MYASAAEYNNILGRYTYVRENRDRCEVANNIFACGIHHHAHDIICMNNIILYYIYNALNTSLKPNVLVQQFA